MKFITTFFTLAALTYAQNIPGIPDCAQSCVVDAIHAITSCDVTDTGCVCASFGAIQGQASDCVIEACGYESAVCKFSCLVKIRQNK